MLIEGTAINAGFCAITIMSCITNQSLRGDTSTERRTEVSKKISDILPDTEILAQLAEEASELAQAALNLRRALDGTNPTPKSVEECEENLLEALADIKVAFTVYLSDSKPCIKARVLEEINKTAEIKLDWWLSRLEAKERLNDKYGDCPVCGKKMEE